MRALILLASILMAFGSTFAVAGDNKDHDVQDHVEKGREANQKSGDTSAGLKERAKAEAEAREQAEKIADHAFGDDDHDSGKKGGDDDGGG